MSRTTSGGRTGVLVAAALWGTVGPAQVLAASAADPGALGVLRLLVGGVALLAFGGGLAAWRAVGRRDVVRWVQVAAAATGVYQVAFMHAVAHLGAALGTTIALGVAPVATGLCARRWTGERLGRRWALGTAAAVAGCAALLAPGGARVDVVGVAAGLLSGACYGVYTVAAKRFLDAGVPAVPATAITLVAAGAALSPLVALHPQHVLDPRSIALVAWIGLAATAGAYAAFVFGLRRTSAAEAGTLSLAEPLLAAVLGVAVLHEHLTTAATVGGAVLLCALVLTSLPGSALRGAPDRRTAASGVREHVDVVGALVDAPDAER
ncbi:MAG: DMT family transporter [Promicromonosporaceae bacterium]|nr:DMT family transporter [Promicromonosporaceae bacterium]